MGQDGPEVGSGYEGPFRTDGGDRWKLVANLTGATAIILLVVSLWPRLRWQEIVVVFTVGWVGGTYIIHEAAHYVALRYSGHDPQYDHGLLKPYNGHVRIRAQWVPAIHYYRSLAAPFIAAGVLLLLALPVLTIEPVIGGVVAALGMSSVRVGGGDIHEYRHTKRVDADFVYYSFEESDGLDVYKKTAK